jgi:hypothetical protein
MACYLSGPGNKFRQVIDYHYRSNRQGDETYPLPKPTFGLFPKTLNPGRLLPFFHLFIVSWGQMKQLKATKKRHKNYFLTFVLILIFWVITGFIVGFVEPELVRDILIPHSYLVLFAPLFLALLLTTSVLLTNTRRGLVITCGVISFLILRLHELGNLLNLILLVGLAAAVEYYFTQKR